jgi:hypothetical protein
MTSHRRPTILLGPGAENNGFASMLSELVRQNLEAKPQKVRDFDALRCHIAIVADDAEVAVTLAFDKGELVVHDGIRGVPDVTIRATSDVIMAMSNIPLTRRFALPLPHPRDARGVAVSKEIVAAMRSGAMHSYGMLTHLPELMHLTRVMSVNG